MNQDFEGMAKAPMTPAERKIWSASHNLPKEYNLVTNDEMMVMANAMKNTSAELRTYQEAHKILEDAVPQEYIDATPDLVNAILVSMKALDQNDQTLEFTLKKLRALRKKLEAATKLAGTTVAPVVFADLVEVAKDLQDTEENITKRTVKKGKKP